MRCRVRDAPSLRKLNGTFGNLMYVVSAPAPATVTNATFPKVCHKSRMRCCRRNDLARASGLNVPAGIFSCRARLARLRPNYVLLRVVGSGHLSRRRHRQADGVEDYLPEDGQGAHSVAVVAGIVHRVVAGRRQPRDSRHWMDASFPGGGPGRCWRAAVHPMSTQIFSRMDQESSCKRSQELDAKH